MIAKQRHITFNKQGLYLLLMLKVKSNLKKTNLGINICTYISLTSSILQKYWKNLQAESNPHFPDTLYSFRRV